MLHTYSFSTPKPYRQPDLPKTFPEDIECIIRAPTPNAGSLYISNVEAASNPATLRRLNITAVLSCAKGYELNHPRTVVPHYKYIPTEDKDDCPISVHFDEAVSFIESRLREGNVLVHCIAGVSRSVSMVLAYFIREHGMHYEEAYRLVKSKRKIISPNDGFIRQLKHYSDTLKAQQRNARRDHTRQDHSPLSPHRQEKSPSIEKQREGGFLDKAMPDFKSVQLTPQRETTPQGPGGDRRGELYERYASTQLRGAYTPISYSRDEPFQSLQHIPDAPQPADTSLTPKARQERQRLDKYDLVRTSTSYFTPTKTTLLNQRPYEPRRYDDYSTLRNERPAQARPEASALGRGDYFSSKNTELNEKIDLIRKKYAAEREKLFNKYQSPLKDAPARTPPDQDSAERRRVSLGEPRPATTRPAEGRTEARPEAYRRANLDPYGQLYSKRFERAVNIAMNEEESLSRADKPLRSSAFESARREGDRLGYSPYAYPSYSPYYKYGTSFKRYY